MKEKVKLETQRVFEILDAFERELNQKIQETKGEVERVKYYETFQIKEINFKNIFITTEKE